MKKDCWVTCEAICQWFLVMKSLVNCLTCDPKIVIHGIALAMEILQSCLKPLRCQLIHVLVDTHSSLWRQVEGQSWKNRSEVTTTCQMPLGRDQTTHGLFTTLENKIKTIIYYWIIRLCSRQYDILNDRYGLINYNETYINKSLDMCLSRNICGWDKCLGMCLPRNIISVVSGVIRQSFCWKMILPQFTNNMIWHTQSQNGI